MSAGRGFVALALVIFGAYHPLGAALTALLFGAALALQFRFQAAGFDVPPELFRSLPYVLSLAILAGLTGRRRAPASLGK
jgi:simple sugar transport system permease protein